MEKEENNQEEQRDYEILLEDFSYFDLSFKLIVVGNSSVGKSCLSSMATKHTFENTHLATIGFEYFNFNIKIGETVIKLQIWDTCGQEFYRSLISSFYHNTSLAIIVYAIDDKKSFDDLEIWLKDLKTNSSPDTKIFLIGNKVDLENQRVITKEMAEKFKEEFDLDYFIETSAKTGFNTQELFVKAAKVLFEDFNEYKKGKIKKEIAKIDLSNVNMSLQLKKEKEKKREKHKEEGKCC